ncbi:MAG: hypothetical protein WCK27_12125, partial [Verrucomicrobiota bacterium]
MKIQPEVSPDKTEGTTMPPAHRAMSAHIMDEKGTPGEGTRPTSPPTKHRNTETPKHRTDASARGRLLCVLALAGSLLGSLGASFVYENAAELQSDGDFN